MGGLKDMIIYFFCLLQASIYRRGREESQRAERNVYRDER